MQRKVTLLWVALGLLLLPIMGQAQVSLALNPTSVTGSAITTVPFTGTITNSGPVSLFLNDLTFQFQGTGLTPSNVRFFDLVPPTLDSGASYTGLLFEVNLDNTVSPGFYSGKVLLSGGTAPDIYGQFSSQPFTVQVISRTAIVTGRIALEGVPDLTAVNPNAGLGAFHISFRAPGTTTETYGFDTTLTLLPPVKDYGVYTVGNLPAGTFDVNIFGLKNLGVTKHGVTVTATSGTVPDTLLPAGDATGDNTCDTSDFNVLVGAFGGNVNSLGSGYDSTADFNYDGSVDTTDFNLLVGEFGNTGDP